MSTSDMKQAREWAAEIAESRQTNIRPDAFAAAEIIQSLPDQWIDAEKVAELADDMANWCLPDVPSTTEIDYRRLIEIMDGFTGRINDLPTPSLPTLAELIEAGNDPQKYQWMQCTVDGSRDHAFVIAVVGELFNKVLRPDGPHQVMSNDRVTPLPDLPKLEWPGGGVEDAPIVDGEPTLPRPKDVPAGEPWIVEFNGRKWMGGREATGETDYPWALSRMDGVAVAPAKDREVTLVSRLVPEDKP